VIKAIQDYIRPLDFYKDISPLIIRLIKYKLSLLPETYMKFYRAAFNDFYNASGDVDYFTTI
jgi:hypothetical protein